MAALQRYFRKTVLRCSALEKEQIWWHSILFNSWHIFHHPELAWKSGNNKCLTLKFDSIDLLIIHTPCSLTVNIYILKHTPENKVQLPSWRISLWWLTALRNPKNKWQTNVYSTIQYFEGKFFLSRVGNQFIFCFIWINSLVDLIIASKTIDATCSLYYFGNYIPLR